VPSWHFGAIGTHWQIDTKLPLPDPVKTAVSDRIELFDKTYSRFRGDSVVTSLAKNPQSVVLQDDAAALFGLYQKLYEATGGSLSPLVGDALSHLGYDSRYRLTSLPGPPPRIPPFEDVISLDGSTLTTYKPVTIDIGAAGKGFLVDLVADILDHHHITDFTVDASGDIAHRGNTAERIALEHPRDPTRALGIANLHNACLAASAVNRRAWGDGLHHIIDALTGLPTASVEATFVVAHTAAEADGLATALFVASVENLSEQFSFEWVVMYSDGRLTSSPNFPGEVFSR
jgi:thiamine biosynthesis lipoprotein